MEEDLGSHSMTLFANNQAIPRYTGFQSNRDKDTFFRDQSSDRWMPVVEVSHKENTRLVEVPTGISWYGWPKTRQQAGNIASKGQIIGNLYRVRPIRPCCVLGDTTRYGAKEVEMRYAPPLRRMGFCISAVALVITLIVGTKNVTVSQIRCIKNSA